MGHKLKWKVTQIIGQGERAFGATPLEALINFLKCGVGKRMPSEQIATWIKNMESGKGYESPDGIHDIILHQKKPPKPVVTTTVISHPTAIKVICFGNGRTQTIDRHNRDIRMIRPYLEAGQLWFDLVRPDGSLHGRINGQNVTSIYYFKPEEDL
jgi:hypothetical protein